MTEAMPFLQKAILLSYDPRPFAGGFLFSAVFPFGAIHKQFTKSSLTFADLGGTV